MHAPFPDFMIISGNKTHYAHRFVVCLHSEYFRCLCASPGGFADPTCNHRSVTLHGDEPWAIEAMVEYFYTFKILPGPRSVEEKIDNFAHVLSIIFTTADKYAVPSLKSLALEEMRHCLEWCGKASSLSKHEFEEATDNLLKATTHAYAHAPSTDDRMKKILLKSWLRDGSMIRKVSKTKFDKALVEVPEFAADVIAALSGRSEEAAGETTK